MKPATRAVQFLQSLRVPEGPKAGGPLKLIKAGAGELGMLTPLGTLEV